MTQEGAQAAILDCEVGAEDGRAQKIGKVWFLRTAKPILSCSTPNFFYVEKEISFLDVKATIILSYEIQKKINQ